MSRLTCPDIRSPSTFLRIFAPWRLCVKISERHPRRPDTESAPDALRPGYLGSSRPAFDSVVHVFRVSRHQAEAAGGDRAQVRVGEGLGKLRRDKSALRLHALCAVDSEFHVAALFVQCGDDSPHLGRWKKG